MNDSKKKKVKILNTILGIIICVAVLVSIIQAFQDYKQSPYGMDLSVFVKSSKMIINHENPYKMEEMRFVYPLAFSVVMIPLSFLPKDVIFFVWLIINITAYILSCLIFIDILIEKAKLVIEKKYKVSAVILLSLIIFPALQTTIRHSQTNTLILLIMVLFLKFYLLEKDILKSSLIISIGISIKIFPAVLLLIPLFNKDIKQILLTFVFCLFFVFILPLIVLNINEVFEFYEYYLNNFLLSKKLEWSNPFLFLPELINSIIPNYFKLQNYLISSLLLIIPIIIKSIRRKITQTISYLDMMSVLLVCVLIVSPRMQSHYPIYLIPAVLIFLTNIYELSFDFYKNKFRTALFIIVLLLIAIGIYEFNHTVYISCYILYLYFLLRRRVIRENNQHFK